MKFEKIKQKKKKIIASNFLRATANCMVLNNLKAHDSNMRNVF